MTKRIFVSYARLDRPTVEHLSGDLHRAGFECFFDEDLVGGQDWWDALMDEIERCDVFIPALSDAYLRSVPCAHEATYASQLDKPFLPVTLESDVPASMCPPRVAQAQWVSYDATGRDVILGLMAALNAMPAAPTLPSELPTRPAVPISYLTGLKAKIEQPEPLSWDEQNLLLAELRGRLEGDEAADVMLLLRRLGQRHDLYEQVANELRSVMASHEAATAPTSAPSGPPPPPAFVGEGAAAPPAPPHVSPPGTTAPGPVDPSSPPGRGRRWWIAAAALIVVAALIGTAVAVRSGSDSTTSTTTSTLDEASTAFAVGLSWFFADNSATTPVSLSTELVACTEGRLADDDVTAISAIEVNADDDDLADSIGIRVMREASRCDYDEVKNILISSIDLASSGLADSDQESCVATSLLGMISSTRDESATGKGGETFDPVIVQSLQACVPVDNVLPTYLANIGIPDDVIDCTAIEAAGALTWSDLLTHAADQYLVSVAQTCTAEG